MINDHNERTISVLCFFLMLTKVDLFIQDKQTYKTTNKKYTCA